MASSENYFVSEHSQVYILRKQEFKVSQLIAILIKMVCFGMKLEKLAWEREVVGQLICVFGQRKEIMSWLPYDFTMMSLPIKAPSGDKTSSEEGNNTLL